MNNVFVSIDIPINSPFFLEYILSINKSVYI